LQLDDVDERAVAVQLNWFANHPDFLERTFGRSELWLYYIVGQLEQRNMPRELALLPVIESAFEPYAYSLSARGRAVAVHLGHRAPFWPQAGLVVRRAARSRSRPPELRWIICRQLHNEFNGDWLLAIAAYNCGELAVERAIQKNQRAGKPTDFWHLKLPAETHGYVPELLAMRRLVANPARYGLEFSRILNEPYFVQISTGGQIDLQVVAKIAGISTEDLYTLNPAFHRWATDPTGPHRLLVPVDASEGLEQTLAQLTPEQRMRIEHYTVQRGDTVATIAHRFTTKPEVIRELNDLGPSDPLVIDTALRVPSNVHSAARKGGCARPCWWTRRRDWAAPSRRAARYSCRAARRYALWHRAAPGYRRADAGAGSTACDPVTACIGDRSCGSARARSVLGSTLAAGKSSAHSTNAASAIAVAASDSGRRVTYKVRRGRYALWHRAAAAGHGHRSGGLERHVRRSQPQAGADAGRLRSIAQLTRHGYPCGQARADRGRRHRAFDRLGHRRGHACPGRRAGLLLRQRQVSKNGSSRWPPRSARSC
jgi:hypothetical protein